MDDADIISLSSGKSENSNSSSSSSNDVILIDGDESNSKTNSDVFKYSSDSNDSNYSDFKTKRRSSPPSSRRKCLLKKKTSTPPDIVVIDDDTQLPGIDTETNIINETFLSLNSSSSSSCSNVPSTPNIMNSTIRSPDELSFEVTSKQNSSATSSYQTNDENDEFQTINEDFCRLATKTLHKNSPETIKSSSSFSSNSSGLQSFRLQNKKNDLPKYGSFKSFNPKIFFPNSNTLIINDTENHQIPESTQLRGKVLPVEPPIFNYSNESESQSSNTTDSLTNNSQISLSITIASINDKKSCYTISSTEDSNSCSSSITRKQFDDSKLNIEPKVFLKKLTGEDIDNYKSQIRGRKNLSIDVNNNKILTENLKRKINNLITISDESSNDCKIIRKTRASSRIYSVDDTSNSNLSNQNNTEELNKNENENNEAINSGKKIVMKLIRKENSQNFMSVSCSEDEATKIGTSTFETEHNLPKISSVSSISTLLIPPKKSKSLNSNKPKTVSNSDLDKNYQPLSTKTQLIPNNETNFIKKNIEEVSKNKTQSESFLSLKPKAVSDLTPKPKTKIAKSTNIKTNNKIGKIPFLSASNIPVSNINEKAAVPERFRIPKINVDTISATSISTKSSTNNSKPKTSTAPKAPLSPASRLKTKSKKPATTSNKNSRVQIPASPKKTRQRTQQQKKDTELEQQKKQKNPIVKNKNRIECTEISGVSLKSNIGIETIFGKTFRSLDDIYIDINTFNLINASAFNNRKFDYGLSYLSLDDNAKMHLLKIMRRRQTVDLYELLENEFNNKKFEFGDIVINEHNMKINPLLDHDENLIINQIRTLNFRETICAYKRFKNLLTTPFRTFEVWEDETIDNVNIRVTFENNGQISSTDSSVEACCLYILHHKNQDFDWIKQSLNNFIVIEPSKEEKIDEQKEIQTIANSCNLYAYINKRIQIPDEDFWDEIHLRKIYKNANIKPTAFDMIVNKTKQNYRSRGLNLNIKRNSDKPKFKTIKAHPVVNRGSKSRIEHFKPVGIPDEQEFEKNFHFYSTHNDLGINYNDVFYDEVFYHNNNEIDGTLETANYLCSP